MNLAAMQGKSLSFTNMIRQNGVLSLYDGLPTGILRQVFYATSRLGLFETCRDKLHEIRGKTDFAGRQVTFPFSTFKTFSLIAVETLTKLFIMCKCSGI